jgi:protein phosphatase 1 regulatory subunit 11
MDPSQPQSQHHTTFASQTQTQTQTSTQPPTLVLRATETEPDEQRHIQWADDVVDNEGMGRKSSKGTFYTRLHLSNDSNLRSVCCIYHKPRNPDESSSDEGDSSSSSSDDGSDDGDDDRARPTNSSRREHNHNHKHHEHSTGKDLRKRSKRPPSPNAYEKVPKYTGKGKDAINKPKEAPKK